MLLKEMSYKACRVGHLLCFDAPQHDNVSFGCVLLDFRHPDVSTGLGQSPIQNTISREIVTLSWSEESLSRLERSFTAV